MNANEKELIEALKKFYNGKEDKLSDLIIKLRIKQDLSPEGFEELSSYLRGKGKPKKSAENKFRAKTVKPEPEEMSDPPEYDKCGN